MYHLCKVVTSVTAHKNASPGLLHKRHKIVGRSMRIFPNPPQRPGSACFWTMSLSNISQALSRPTTQRQEASPATGMRLADAFFFCQLISISLLAVLSNRLRVPPNMTEAPQLDWSSEEWKSWSRRLKVGSTFTPNRKCKFNKFRRKTSQGVLC